MRPVILSRPEKVATGLAVGWANAGPVMPKTPSAAIGARTVNRRGKAVRWRKAPALLRRPGVVVTGDAGAFALVEQAAIGPIGCRGAGQILLVRQFPVAGRVIGLGGHDIGAVMHPAMPALANGGSVGGTGIGHIASVGLAILVVLIAEFVAADIVAEAPDPQTGAPSLTAPPGEDFAQELLDTGFSQLSIPPSRGASAPGVSWCSVAA